MSLCSWLVEGTGRKGSPAGLLPGSIEARPMCSEHGWLPYQLAKISLSFSLPVRDWMPPEKGIVGGPSEATTLWCQSH